MSSLQVAVIGGGLVGALEACLLAKRGFKVTLFESRHDGRKEPTYYGRSINLAISLRGISALKRLNLEHIVAEQAIPMSGRMIHGKNGKTTPIPYDPDGRCINSIERAALNNFLLSKAENEFHVKILYNHKLVDMNTETGEVWFRQTSGHWPDSSGDGEKTQGDTLAKYAFDLILGCDGSRSMVRSLMARQTKMEVSQNFIEHGYLELRIDPREDGAFRMPENYLHIWPRGEYMMIALPNKDQSFTCTLFMPYDVLKQLKEPAKAINFFKVNFPDSVELIGAERIESTLSQVSASSLISIKCKPYHYKNRVALLGDSAHAMVPFYGQGMNCGFEDCLVLDELFDEYLPSAEIASASKVFVSKQLSIILGKYSEHRCSNGRMMCELAMYNYVEMRDLVNTWSFRLRKQVDNMLYKILKSNWTPLYTMVTFTRTPIDVCVERRRRQDKILNSCLLGSALLLGSCILIWARSV